MYRMYYVTNDQPAEKRVVAAVNPIPRGSTSLDITDPVPNSNHTSFMIRGRLAGWSTCESEAARFLTCMEAAQACMDFSIHGLHMGLDELLHACGQTCPGPGTHPACQPAHPSQTR